MTTHCTFSGFFLCLFLYFTLIFVLFVSFSNYLLFVSALETRPDHVHLAPMPNFFRGLYTLDDAAATGIQVDPTPEEEELLAAKYAGMLLIVE